LTQKWTFVDMNRGPGSIPPAIPTCPR